MTEILTITLTAQFKSIGIIVASPQCLYSLLGHSAAVRSLLVAGDRLFSGSDDATVRVWDLFRLEAKQVLRGHSSSVTDIAYGSGRLVTASRDKTVRVYEDGQ
jgi:WD40 repeat protein